jgi:hypothetical protein
MSEKIVGNLTKEEFVRAWQDHEYRETLDQSDIDAVMSLSEAERDALLQESLSEVTLMELSDDELEVIAGGADEVDVDVSTKSCWVLSCSSSS